MTEIAEFLKDFPSPIYFVGGCVRDTLLGIEPHDYDLFTALEPDDVQNWLKGRARSYLTGKRFGTIGFKFKGMTVEITTFRSEIYDKTSRKPVVKFSKFIEEDIRRRDFTINAICCDMNGNVKDYVNGVDDLNKKILRCVGNPTERFQEDPLRILRGIRLTSKFELLIEEKTREKLIHTRWELLRLSKERIVEEMEKMFTLEPILLADCIEIMFCLDIFQVIFPELSLQLQFNQENPNHKHELHTHTFLTVEETRKEHTEPEYLWSALFHDIGKPFTKVKAKNKDYFNYLNHDILGAEIAQRYCNDYHFSNAKTDFIVKSIREHQNEDSWLKKYDDLAKK